MVAILLFGPLKMALLLAVLLISDIPFGKALPPARDGRWSTLLTSAGIAIGSGEGPAGTMAATLAAFLLRDTPYGKAPPPARDDGWQTLLTFVGTGSGYREWLTGKVSVPRAWKADVRTPLLQSGEGFQSGNIFCYQTEGWRGSYYQHFGGQPLAGPKTLGGYNSVYFHVEPFGTEIRGREDEAMYYYRYDAVTDDYYISFVFLAPGPDNTEQRAVFESVVASFELLDA